MALDAALTFICKRREDSFFVRDEVCDSPPDVRGKCAENQEANSPSQVGEAASSSGGSGHGADENQPRNANMDRVDAMRLAAQQAAIREQVAHEMESACKGVSLHEMPCKGTVPVAASTRMTRTASPSGGRGPLVQQQPLPFSRSVSMASTASYVPQPQDILGPPLVRVPSSDSFRSTSSLRSTSALRPSAQSPRPAVIGGSLSLPIELAVGRRRPPESPHRAPGSAGPGRALPETFTFVEDGIRASTPQRLRQEASSSRLHPSAPSNRPRTPNAQRPNHSIANRPMGPRLGSPSLSGGQIHQRANPVHSHRAGRSAPRRTRQELANDSLMSDRLNAAAELIDGLVIDSSMLEEARRTAELAREADSLSARPTPWTPERASRRSRSCNVFWRPPPEAVRVCETARSPNFPSDPSRPESLDGSGGSAVHRALSEKSRPVTRVLGMSCIGFPRDDSWGTNASSLSFALQHTCGSHLPQAAPQHATPSVRVQQQRSIRLSPRELI